MSDTFIRDNREQYPALGIVLPGIQDTRDQGRYHSPATTEDTLVADTEKAIALPAGTGKVIITSQIRKSFSVAWAMGGIPTFSPSGDVYVREDICKNGGPTTMWVTSGFAGKITIETWLIGS